nr:NADH dehydrogenase subunit 4L [Thaumaglossa rufocapillata]
MYFMFIFFLMFLFGLLSFCLSRAYLLLMLLSLEFIVLSLFSFIIFYICDFKMDTYLSMIFLSMTVCEGSLGLSILVSLVRTHGSDNFKVFSVLW